MTKEGTWAAAGGPINTPAGWEEVEIAKRARQEENEELQGIEFGRVRVSRLDPIKVEGPLEGIASSPVALEDEMRCAESSSSPRSVCLHGVFPDRLPPGKMRVWR